MNEAETRAELIDPMLATAGWGVITDSRIHREYQITKGRLQGARQREKQMIVDYILSYKNHMLAVIEAKPRDAADTAAYFGSYPADFFDFIIVDECHRGGANDESTGCGID